MAAGECFLPRWVQGRPERVGFVAGAMIGRLQKGLVLGAMLSLAAIPQELAAGVKGMPEGTARVKVGDAAPLETEELKEIRATGKAIVLMFGNPWHCLYCERVWLNLKELLPKYEKDLTLVLVSAQRVKFWEPPDENVRLARRYGIVGEPWVFLIDKNGIVRHIFVGFTGLAKLEAELNNLLRLPGAR